LSRGLPRASHHERGASRRADGRESSRSGHRRGVRGRRRHPVKRPIAELWGTGSYTPKRVLTNDEFSKILDTSDQWIRERTGIRERRVATEQAQRVLVVASEKLTSIMDWTDRTTAVLFGDGAGATIVRRSTTGRGILSSYMKSDGTLAELLYRPGGGAAHPPDEAL